MLRKALLSVIVAVLLFAPFAVEKAEAVPTGCEIMYYVTGFNYTVWQYCELFQARNYVAEFVEPGGQSGGAEW
jgi:hypothetical protein